MATFKLPENVEDIYQQRIPVSKGVAPAPVQPVPVHSHK